MIAVEQRSNPQANMSRFSRSKTVENFLNGFDSHSELDALVRNSTIARRRINPIDRVISENLANMKSHPQEYTKSNPVVLNPVEFNSQDQIVGKESKYRIVDMISEDERDGSVVDFMRTTEQRLLQALLGDMVIGISPTGVTGRYEGGKELVYEEAQVYVFKKGAGRLIEGITFIADLSYAQCLELYGKYQEPDESFSNMNTTERARVAEMVRRPISVTGGFVSIESVLDNIEAVMGGKIMRKANGKNRTFEEARQLLADPDKMNGLPSECGKVLGVYEQYLRVNIADINNPKTALAIKQRMEIAMLEITRIIIGEDSEETNIDAVEQSKVYLEAFSSHNTNLLDYNLVMNVYDEQIKYLMTRPGCMGKASSSFGVTGQSLGDILSQKSSITSLSGESGGVGGKCKVCGVNACSEGGCGYCDGCASKAA